MNYVNLNRQLISIRKLFGSLLTFASGCGATPESIALTLPNPVPYHSVPLGTVVGDRLTQAEVALHDCGVFIPIGVAAVRWTCKGKHHKFRNEKGANTVLRLLINERDRFKTIKED